MPAIGRRSIDRQTVAIHEAGHAVMAYVFYRRVHWVTIKPRGDIAGRARRSQWMYNLARPHEIEQEILIDLAGGAAEGLLVRHRVWVGCEDDLAFAEEAANVLGLRGNWRREFYDRAQALLTPRWSYVRAVADALSQKTWLRQAELPVLLDGCARLAPQR